MTGILNILAGSISSAIKDGYFNLVSLLLPGNGTNGAQNNTFLDESSNAFSITRNGNTTQGTFSPFSQTGWSNYFGAYASGNVITYSPGSSVAFGTGDFTIEAWVYFESDPGSGNNPYIIDSRTSASWAFSWNFNGTANALQLSWTNASGVTNQATTAMAINQWNHCAYVRSGTTGTIYLNGVSILSFTDNTNYSASVTTAYIGKRYANSQGIPGYLSNLRIVKGTAVYTGAFTPPTTPLTAITNTQLLTCQSNRFLDNSSNAFAITVNGSPSVQAFSPFAPTAAYSAATNGGSGYFDGTGDYLSLTGGVTDNGTGDLTFEFWSYYTGTYSAEAVAFDSRANPFTNGIALAVNASSGNWSLNFALTDLNTGFAAAKNAWQHIALTRSGNTFRFFIDGVLRGVLTSSNNLTNNTNRIGTSYNDGSPFPGYLSNMRSIKGSIPTAYQTSSTTTGTSVFTPPTSPVTAVSGTSFLANFTNSGITDATAKNVLETVGNAQISTTQSKFGGSSMYFNGTTGYLQAPNSKLANFGAGNFTIEFWMYASSQTIAPIVHQVSYASNNGWILWNFDNVGTGNSTRKLTFMAPGNTNLVTTSDAYADNTWTHIAVVKNGTTVTIYSNGTSVGSSTFATAFADSTNPLMVAGIINGVSWNLTAYYAGYIDDLRITKGYARYTANFTPPTAAFPLQ